MEKILIQNESSKSSKKSKRSANITEKPQEVTASVMTESRGANNRIISAGISVSVSLSLPPSLFLFWFFLSRFGFVSLVPDGDNRAPGSSRLMWSWQPVISKGETFSIRTNPPRKPRLVMLRSCVFLWTNHCGPGNEITWLNTLGHKSIPVAQVAGPLDWQTQENHVGLERGRSLQ